MHAAAQNPTGTDAWAADARLPADIRAGLASASTTRDAQAWAAQLARTHYENFPVLSLLIPRDLRQDFASIYAYCRVADDLADELGDPQSSLVALGQCRAELTACFAGSANRTVFVALRETIHRHDLSITPLADLLDAFEQDQRVSRYETFDDLLGYCRRSANPVGRLVLWLCGYRDEPRAQLSDHICTGLQLANFWQDVRRDVVERNRIYIPRESMRQFGVSETQIEQGVCDENFRRLIKHEVNRAQEFFDRGQPLLDMLRPSVRAHVSMFRRGGLATLDAIRRSNYDTLTRRPTITRWGKLRIVARGLVAHLAAWVSSGGAS